MSKKWIVGILVIVVVVAALWYGKTYMMSDSAGAPQTAGVINSVNGSTENSLPAIAQDIVNLDAQLLISGNSIADLGNNASGAKVGSAGDQLQTAANTLTKISTKLQSRITGITDANKKASLLATLNAISANILNATSQTTVAVNNTKGPKTPTATALQQVQTQLGTAQTYLKTARASVQAVMAGLSQ